MQEQTVPQVERSDKGFTLIELLIAIVVVGILTAVAIVGIRGLNDSGETAACNASRDAAQAAVAVYAANNNGANAPDLVSLTTANPPLLVMTGSATVAASTITGQGGWTLVYTQATGAFSACV